MGQTIHQFGLLYAQVGLTGYIFVFVHISLMSSVGGQEYARASSATKKLAQEEAALRALRILRKLIVDDLLCIMILNDLHALI